MKRRHRKPVLDINRESSESSRRRWPSDHYSPHNGSPVNSLSNLIGQYNSDDESEPSSKPRSHKLNDQVNDFLKEIQSIAPEDKKDKKSSAHPGSFWQECFDEQTGFPYYWHTETNQVTWEVPPELKMMQEENQRETTTPLGAQVSPWSNIPPNNFTQQNIPEGMIPKEVVARNRNRQAGIISTKEKSPVKINKSSGYKDESFEDEKIEMITSFGNDESESEESEHEDLPKITPILKKPSTKTSKSSHSSNKNTSSDIPRTQIGPALPPTQFGPQNQEKLSERLSQNLQSTKSSNKNSSGNSEEEILSRLKNQAKFLKSKLNDEPGRESKSKISKDLKLSLVPGYEDDSDGDDEISTRRQVKPLFPIAESSSNFSNNKVAKTIETNTGNIRIYEYKNAESTGESSKQVEESSEAENTEETSECPLKPEQESKANKFLESIGESAKGFQRKKRIAFDVAPTKSKQESLDEPVAENVGSPSNSKDETNLTETEPTKNNVEGSKKPTIAFVKASEDDKSPGDSNNSSSSSGSIDKEDKPKEISETEKAELRTLTEPIMEKLKFLSEGSPAASAVQIMAIQIQTLLCAWESGVLQEAYLRNWLAGTGCELTRLEQTAAPPGWECQWDRTHKRYFYRNTSTNEAQWTYPQTDIAGGTEEMELCTTPPPPEHVETPIIEMRTQTENATTTCDTPVTTTTTTTSLTAAGSKSPPPPPPPVNIEVPVVPPPPPTISSPSPPPPPRINAEDLKRGQKRKEHPDEVVPEKKEDLPKESKRPPDLMPPGVDPSPPEPAYALPVSALEAANVLYGAQQTNPIYAATLAGAGIPLISHHPHLMQGPLVHYTPATYHHHPHLHNQALVAAARLQGQEAVQFMVAEYARMYENNQVIAKPPVKVTHDAAALGSALNSFYSDIASIEKTRIEVEKEKLTEIRVPEMVVMHSPVVPPVPVINNDGTPDVTQEKKKKKLKTGIGKKQKEMSSMVAKWQMAQKVYKEGHR